MFPNATRITDELDMSIGIKICGLSTPEAVETASRCGADMIGFIFFEKSPRHVEPEKVAELCSGIDLPARVAVTVNADDTRLDHIVEVMKPDILQLHGLESPERMRHIAGRYNLPMIKAFSIYSASDFESLAAYEGVADQFLLDAKAPKGSELPGGNGVSFDWNLLGKLKTNTPWMLSGGLDATNIERALEISAAGMIDVSSGVESAPGIKDIAKIAAFIKTVRAMDGSGSNTPLAV